MHIAQIIPLLLETPPHAYGGTEFIVSLLTEELVRRGHQVTLFATANSQTQAELVPIWPKGLFKDATVREYTAIHSMLLAAVLDQHEKFDIIHDHTETILTSITPLLKPPLLTTLHGIFTPERVMLYKKFKKVPCVAISHDQRRSGPGINIIKTIHHGIPMERYEFNAEPNDYLLWLSNIAPDKGLAHAIEIAKMSDEKLLIAGPIFPHHADYFDYRIKPLIDGEQIQFVGIADFEKKLKLLQNAKAFLFPIFSRKEPFGLVVIEAMACGTPVITAPQGAMPELIEHGKTGFLINSVEEGRNAIKKIDTISREYCRAYAEKHFPLKKMVDAYEGLYQKILSSRQ